ncbi:glycosyltransferase [Lactococcus sp.]|uniref:glycosyltransferase n=1 Tax=Lactococcus sp. TaxID=44273 RepID=UPI0035B4AF4B
MIFVTVGTHEQAFNRLIQKIDELVRDGEITEEVFMQIGYSTYEPKYSKWARLIGYDDMEKYMREADVVITHGGPSTYMQVLQLGKIPVVVPRQEKYNEHVNNHQLWVSNQVLEKNYPILLCEEMNNLLFNIEKSKRLKELPVKENHNAAFMKQFEIEIKNLISKKENR